MQEIFDKVATHLLRQNARSTNSIEACRYRGVNGLKCAIGALIPDPLYDSRLEGRRVTSLCVLDYLYQAGVIDSESINSKKIQLLLGLQRMHDGSPPSLWDSDLRKLAIEYRLNSAICDLVQPTIPVPIPDDIAFSTMMSNLVKEVSQPATPATATVTKEGVTA
jgi:hypothetical protein